MAHKTLISGTAYSVTGGRELIGGTGYGCKAGKTLIGGTAFDVPFGQTEYVLTIRGGSAQRAGAYVTYGGQKYGSGTLRIPVGDSVRVSVGSSNGNVGGTWVKLSGAGTLSGGGISGNERNYTYIPAANATIQFTKSGMPPQYVFWTGTITEE